MISEIAAKMFRLVKEEGVSQLDAWNRCSTQLISAARVRNLIFIKFYFEYNQIFFLF